MQQDYNDLATFAAVVECGNFTAAAEQLRVGKSQVSQRIARLEERLDIHLVHRTTRQQQVTDFGREYYRHCRRMLDAAERAQQLAEQAKEKPAGEVRVACPPLFSELILQPIVVDFMRECPDVSLHLHQRYHDVDVVRDGYQLAFRVTERIDDSSLVARTMGHDGHVLVASPDRVRARRIASPADLDALPTLAIATSGVRGNFQWRLGGPGGQSRVIRHKPCLATDDLLLLRTAAVAGRGVVALPGFLCAEFIGRGELEIVLPEWTLPTMTVHMVYPSRQGLPPAVRHFVDFTAPRIGQRLDELHAVRGVGAAQGTA